MAIILKKNSEKIDREFIRQCYLKQGPVQYYTDAVYEVGLWESEKIIFQKYLKNKEDKIIDIGCGAGRVAISLYKLGYHNTIGLDISKSMTDRAKQIANQMGVNIDFYDCDAVAMPFDNNIFDMAIFAFNGLMQIPGIENRIKVMLEVKRILKPGGYFIFASHDRDRELQWDLFWIKEKEKWLKGIQDIRLHELGDRIIKGKAEDENTFLHFPNREEIIYSLKKAGLLLIEDIWREDLCEESSAVRKFSHNNRFWITQKPGE